MAGAIIAGRRRRFDLDATFGIRPRLNSLSRLGTDQRPLESSPRGDRMERYRVCVALRCLPSGPPVKDVSLPTNQSIGGTCDAYRRMVDASSWR